MGLAGRTRRRGLESRPVLMHRVLTFMRRTVPFTWTRIFWTFGLTFRFVRPVTFSPTPPKRLASPLRATVMPRTVRFPQSSHFRAMVDTNQPPS